jgi:hypothetical protein
MKKKEFDWEEERRRERLAEERKLKAQQMYDKLRARRVHSHEDDVGDGGPSVTDGQ